MLALVWELEGLQQQKRILISLYWMTILLRFIRFSLLYAWLTHFDCTQEDTRGLIWIMQVIQWCRFLYTNIQIYIQFRLTVSVSAVAICVLEIVGYDAFPLNVVQVRKCYPFVTSLLCNPVFPNPCFCFSRCSFCCLILLSTFLEH